MIYRILLFIFLFQISPLTKAVESRQASKFLLSIGIQNFQDPIWSNLQYTQKDAKDIFSFFRDKASFDYTRLLGNAKGIVDHSDIMDAMNTLENLSDNENDVVVVYLSTHGTVKYNENGQPGRYIVTSNTEANRIDHTAVSYKQLISSFRRLKSRKKVLILAFCYSGIGKSILTPEMELEAANLKGPFFPKPIDSVSEGEIILSASGWQEAAVEDQKLQNDVYTHFLLEGLNRDPNQDGAITITEAHSYATQKTYSYTQGRQRPSAVAKILGADPIVIKGEFSDKDSSYIYSTYKHFSKLILRVNGKNLGRLTKGYQLPAGRSLIEILPSNQSQVLASRVLTLEPGKEYSISAKMFAAPSHSVVGGFSLLRFTNSSVSRSYLPGTYKGVSSNYTIRDGFGLYDMQIGFQFLYKEKEQVNLSGGYKALQSRKIVVTDLLVTRNLAPSWIKPNRNQDFFLEGGFGISALIANRKLHDSAIQRQDQWSVAPGLVAMGGIKKYFTPQDLVLGFQGYLRLQQNFTDHQSDLLSAINGTLYLGAVW